MKKKDAFNKVIDYEKKYHMIAAGDRLVAGISGGADSICLLFMLIRMQQEIPFSITAVHVNHQLRAEEAERDQHFVEEICRQKNIPCRVFSEDVQAMAKAQGLTLEEAGRAVRRKCFYQVLEEENADKIVVAHHKNDNAETFLLNLARGAGLTGLGGMRPVNGKMIRPLLCLSRAEIESWLESQEIAWCTDSSNASDHYTRNRIRNHILPMLEAQVNEKTVEHLQETMEQMQLLKDYVETQCERAMEHCVIWEPDGCCQVNQKALEREHPYLQTEILKRVLIRTGGQAKDVAQVHVESLQKLLEKQVGREIHLPYGVNARRIYEGICLYHPKENTEFQELELQIPGETYVPWADKTIVCSVVTRNEDFSLEQIEENPYTKWFDYDIINNTVQIRTRQAGDFLTIDENGHSQKLKSWFINEKIPSAQRESMMLLACGNEVLWIPGHRRGSRYLVTDKTKDILKIHVYGGKKDGRNN